MTVRDLITRLAAYPPDATVVNVHDAMSHEPRIIDSNGGNAHTFLLVGAKPLKHGDNPYRRGALEQLFDGCSTGIEDDPA